MISFGVFFFIVALLCFEHARNAKAKSKAMEHLNSPKVQIATQKKVASNGAEDNDRPNELRKLVVPDNFPKTLNLYFGSQSGTAENFCKVLEDEAALIGCFEKTKIINFEDFDADTFGKDEDSITMICVATHYEGEPCDNTAEFYKWLKQ